MKAWVEYNVPVLVQVDTETREVTRVIQMDEEISSPVAAFEDDGTGPNGTQILRTRDRQSLYAIANDGDWPTWESGF